MPPLHVGVICTGNICRSPMGEVALTQLVRTTPELRTMVVVSSAGTARWHEGAPMDPRARRALDRAGFTGPGTNAAFADTSYIDRHDLLLVMTREHRLDVLARRTNPHTEVLLIRNVLTPGLDLDVADPYYGSDREFDDCLAVLVEAGQCLIERRSLEFGSR